MAWRTIAATETDPGAPGTSELFKALADNPAAIANADSGAPKIVDAALTTSATNTGRVWVLARTALADVGAVGTYAFLAVVSGGNVLAGETRAGADLEYSDSDGQSSTSPAGTWRAMGNANPGTSGSHAATLWLRIA